MEGEDFDAVVLGERVPGRWMAGSDFFRRTQGEQEQKENASETGGSNVLVQVAITYAGNQVSLFRNGKPYSSYTVPESREFGTNTTALIGLRYFGQMGEIGFFNGAIDDARIYDRALSEDEVSALARAGAEAGSASK